MSVRLGDFVHTMSRAGREVRIWYDPGDDWWIIEFLGHRTHERDYEAAQETALQIIYTDIGDRA